MLPYEKLVAWQQAHAVVLAVYRHTATFPAHERFGLTAQTRRAAFSAAANIAEGAAKRGDAEFRRFLDISLGSLSELAYCLRLARDLGYLTDSAWAEVEALRATAGKTTWGLYRSVAERVGRSR